MSAPLTPRGRTMTSPRGRKNPLLTPYPDYNKVIKKFYLIGLISILCLQHDKLHKYTDSIMLISTVVYLWIKCLVLINKLNFNFWRCYLLSWDKEALTLQNWNRQQQESRTIILHMLFCRCDTPTYSHHCTLYLMYEPDGYVSVRVISAETSCRGGEGGGGKDVFMALQISEFHKNLLFIDM